MMWMRDLYRANTREWLTKEGPFHVNLRRRHDPRLCLCFLCLCYFHASDSQVWAIRRSIIAKVLFHQTYGDSPQKNHPMTTLYLKKMRNWDVASEIVTDVMPVLAFVWVKEDLTKNSELMAFLVLFLLLVH